jgi:FKBP-type peptidyl-prolyl cis-trans isomerase (trigger factor)
LVLDEIARHEKFEVSTAELEEEVSRQAERGGRTVSATRAMLEKDGGVVLLAPGLRREKAIDFVMAHATVVAV